MPNQYPSSAEARLESQRLGPLQLRVAFICMLAQMFDGYDITSIGMAVPSLSAAWHIPGPAFANTFVMSSVGIMVGALLSGPAGDRLGRKPVLIASLVFLAVSSLACMYATTIPELVLWRFITGIGIGGIMPATVALTSDYVPERLRAPIVMVIFTGNPLGGFLGGQAIALLLPHFGWPVIFFIGGILPLVLIPVMLFWLPESPRFLLARGHMTTRTERLLQTLNIEPAGTGDGTRHEVDVHTGNPVAGLFRDGLASTTVLVWALYFANLLSLYLIQYWLPTVLNLSGLAPADAVFAASLMAAGPLVSVFAMAPLSRRFGPQRVLAVMLSTGVLVIAAVGLANPPHDLLLLAIFLMGCCTIGAMTGINGMTAALYPARVRTTGMGWALGIGRLGGIGGPWLGGVLLTAGWPPRQIFLCACVTALIATFCVVMLHIVERRREPRAIPRIA
ncbi:MAG: MFS transporter [Acetobacteraceae bacterium]|jgi:AAHS family 4-hydroxybenzoate transporter-like MFS transporter